MVGEGRAGSRRGAQVIEWLRLYGKSHLPPTPPLHLAHPPASGFSVLPAAPETPLDGGNVWGGVSPHLWPERGEHLISVW